MMKNFSATMAVSALVLLSNGGAFAQTAGVYSGTSADGQALSFTVGTDTNGATAITSVSAGVQTTTCQTGGSPFGFGTGYDPDAVPTSAGHVSYVEEYSYTYQSVTGVFSGNTFSGKIFSVSPTLVLPAGNAKPHKSVICTSPLQTFSATLSTTASKAADAELRKVAVYTIKK